MKKNFKSAISIIFFIILFAVSSKAQQPAYVQVVSKSSSQLFPGNFPSKNSDEDLVSIEKINAKLLDRFNKNFSHATNVKWERLGDNYLAIFSINETNIRSLFNKNGKLLYRIDYCSENQVPSYIINWIKNDYDDYLITHAAKVCEDNREIWIIQLSGQVYNKIVRLEDGEMDEVLNYQRAN